MSVEPTQERVDELERELSFDQRDDFTVSDEVWQKTQAYNDDGTTTVGIYDYEIRRGVRPDGGDSVRVKFRTATLEEKYEEMPWPDYPDPDKYKFIQLLHGMGLEFTGVEYLRAGEPEKAKADPNSWKLVPEEPPQPVHRRMKNSVSQKLLEFLKNADGLLRLIAGLSLAAVPVTFLGLMIFGGETLGLVFWSSLLLSFTLIWGVLDDE